MCRHFISPKKKLTSRRAEAFIHVAGLRGRKPRLRVPAHPAPDFLYLRSQRSRNSKHSDKRHRDDDVPNSSMRRRRKMDQRTRNAGVNLDPGCDSGLGDTQEGAALAQVPTHFGTFGMEKGHREIGRRRSQIEGRMRRKHRAGLVSVAKELDGVGNNGIQEIAGWRENAKRRRLSAERIFDFENSRNKLRSRAAQSLGHSVNSHRRRDVLGEKHRRRAINRNRIDLRGWSNISLRRIGERQCAADIGVEDEEGLEGLGSGKCDRIA